MPGKEFPMPGKEFPLPGKEFPMPGKEFPMPGKEFAMPGKELPVGELISLENAASAKEIFCVYTLKAELKINHQYVKTILFKRV